MKELLFEFAVVDPVRRLEEVALASFLLPTKAVMSLIPIRSKSQIFGTS